MKTVIKTELIAAIAEAAPLSQRDVRAVLGLLAEIIHAALRRGDEVLLPEIGTLTPVWRGARMGCNPHTGEEIAIPARRVAKFKPAKALRDALTDDR